MPISVIIFSIIMSLLLTWNYIATKAVCKKLLRDFLFGAQKTGNLEPADVVRRLFPAHDFGHDSSSQGSEQDSVPEMPRRDIEAFDRRFPQHGHIVHRPSPET